MPKCLEAVTLATLEIPSNFGSCHIGDSKQSLKFGSCYVGDSRKSTDFEKCQVNDYGNTVKVCVKPRQIAKNVYIEFLERNKWMVSKIYKILIT